MPETTSYTLSTSDMISMLLYHSNQSPIGIKWSAVPLPCSTFLSFHRGKQGSGPNRGQSPVEWGDYPYICLFIHPSPYLGQAWLAGPQAWLDGLEEGTKVQTNECMFGKSPHSTGLCPLSELLPKKLVTHGQTIRGTEGQKDGLKN